MLTLLLGKHIAREMEILNWSSSFPTRSFSSHSPSCTSVQSPTRTSELLNTRKWEIALKWKCWEMNLPCQTASVLFYKSLPFSLASLSFGCVSQMAWKWFSNLCPNWARRLSEGEILFGAYLRKDNRFPGRDLNGICPEEVSDSLLISALVWKKSVYFLTLCMWKLQYLYLNPLLRKLHVM